MAFFPSILPQQIKLAFKGLSTGKLVAMAILIGGIIAGFAFLLNWSETGNLHPLYSNLAPEDASQIVSRLRERQIPYQLSMDGTGVFIPYEKIYETRLELASEGLPRGDGIGFEVFDETELGMTEFVQNVNYQRALQGELSRTINTLLEVENSRVHIVMPARSLFIEDEEPATASVIVKLRRGKYLNKEQIQGIVHLVSSSVSRLEPEDVTVIDNSGKMLAGFKETSTVSQVTSNQLAFQEKKERILENRVKTMLESVLGQDKAIVRVSCLLNFVQQEKTEELYLPDNSVVRSEQTSTSIVNGAGLTASGVPGLQSNVVPNNSGVSGQKGAKGNQKQQFTKNYEVSKRVNRQIMPVGSIQRLSVAVVVDGSYQQAEEGAEGEQAQYVQRTAEEMAKLESIVKSAVDYDATRGDKIEVVNIPFETQLSPEMAAAPATAGWLETIKTHQELIKYSAAALFFLLSYMIVLKPLARWLTSTPIEEIQMLEQLPQTIKELERRYAEAGTENSYTRQLENVIKENRSGSTRLMKEWLKET
ncbi:flagellar basal-body MS-ring/collar protein FliF [Desulfosarcina ovata]|uniref:Flagellar M-ring protein n=1 Tax=Desulfosarcina ovata subsp. ovata TaxID=2752305 RepID=A0A5K8A752_9BACT|nr:flagellar basal-body MS-ring/collar protein FliF [Desulfosarcina ovata]BBO88301.1 flagellar M-ring protein [Desulfosarcina ovata subsp. ovata]